MLCFIDFYWVFNGWPLSFQRVLTGFFFDRFHFYWCIAYRGFFPFTFYDTRFFVLVSIEWERKRKWRTVESGGISFASHLHLICITGRRKCGGDVIVGHRQRHRRPASNHALNYANESVVYSRHLPFSPPRPRPPALGISIRSSNQRSLFPSATDSEPMLKRWWHDIEGSSSKSNCDDPIQFSVRRCNRRSSRSKRVPSKDTVKIPKEQCQDTAMVRWFFFFCSS